MKRTHIIYSCLALTFACGAPPIVKGDDLLGETPHGLIRGHVLISPTDPDLRGDAVLYLFREEEPPPPQGTGSPITFTMIPSEELFTSSANVPPFIAPFTFTRVEAGRYLLLGFLDRIGSCPPRTCERDFIPWFGPTNEPSFGDIQGGHVDPVTQQPLTIELAAADGESSIPPVEGVTVAFDELSMVSMDRPAFSVSSPPFVDTGNLPTPASPGGLPLTGSDLELTLSATPIVEGVVRQTAPTFAVRFVDDDLDGVPDDNNGDTVPDLWPKIIVRKLSDNPSQPYYAGELPQDAQEYPHLNANLDGKPAIVILAAGIDPSSFLPQLVDGQGDPDMNKVLLTDTLTLVVKSMAFDVVDPDHPSQLTLVPAGRYGIVVQQFTGQTWSLPNELAPLMKKIEPLGLPSVPGQGFWLTQPSFQ